MHIFVCIMELFQFFFGKKKISFLSSNGIFPNYFLQADK